MKIHFEKLFKRDLSNTKIFLLFGNDDFTLFRAVNYIRQCLNNPRTMTEKEYLETHILQAPDLFSNNQENSYIIENVGEKSLPNLKIHSSQSLQLIFLSSKLRSGSPMVKFVESLPEGLAIPCYDAPLNRDEFQFYFKNLSISSELASQFFSTFANQPSAFFNVLKLLNSVSNSHQELILKQIFLNQNNQPSDISFLFHFLMKDRDNFIAHLPPISSSERISTIRTLSTIIQTLYQLKTPGNSPMNPPIFFKDRPHYQKATNKWSLHTLSRTLYSLLHLEKKTKLHGCLDLNPFLLFHMERSLHAQRDGEETSQVVQV